MLSLDNINNIIKFKKRLRKARDEKNLTQKELAKILNIGRTSIVSWENEKNDTVPTLKSFVEICSLLDVDPNYILGRSDIESNNDREISQAIGISYSNIRILRDRNYTNHFVDFFLSSLQSQEIINRIKQICYYKFIYEAMETSFSSNTLQKIDKAFERFYREVFPLDMNVDNFELYIKKEIPWDSRSISIDDYISSAITENEYKNILFVYPDFNTLLDEQKHNLLIHNIATTSYDYMIKSSIIDLSRNEIAKALDNIVDDFIKTENLNFKSRKKKTAPYN